MVFDFASQGNASSVNDTFGRDERMFKSMGNMLKKSHFRLLKVIAVLCICSVFAGTVLAEAGAPAPYDRTGSIDITLRYNNRAVTGGSVTMYQVADVVMTNQYWYRYTSDFVNFGTSAGGAAYSASNPAYITDAVFENTTLKLSDMAAGLKDYIQANGISGTAIDVSTGSAVVSDLPAGLYLFVQTDEEAADGFYPIAPFLVTMPGEKINDSTEVSADNYNWDVVAAPKLELIPEKAPEPVSVDPSITKKVETESGTELKNDELPEDVKFVFTFEAENADFPMPVNPNAAKEGKVMRITLNGAETKEIGVITFTKPGEYYYTVEEEVPENGSFTRDATKYSLFYDVQVSDDGSRLEVKNCEIREATANDKIIEQGNDDIIVNYNFVFTNTYVTITPTPSPSPTPTPSITITITPPASTTPRITPKITTPPTTPHYGDKLPQTGQLWWPIWLLAGVGILLITGGIVMKKRGKKA